MSQRQERHGCCGPRYILLCFGLFPISCPEVILQLLFSAPEEAQHLRQQREASAPDVTHTLWTQKHPVFPQTLPALGAPRQGCRSHKVALGHRTKDSSLTTPWQLLGRASQRLVPYFQYFHLLRVFSQLSQKDNTREKLRGEQGWKMMHGKNPGGLCFEKA